MDTITRQDQYFDAMSGGSSEIPEPITRKEKFYAKMAGDESVETPEPVTREEYWLHKIIEHGGGGSTTIEELNVTENGTYSETGKAYSPVKVNVPNPSTGALNITENGTYDVTEKASAVVNVGGGGGGLSTVISGSFTGTANGLTNIELPYEGNGYPIALVIMPVGGAKADIGSLSGQYQAFTGFKINVGAPSSAATSKYWTGSVIKNNYGTLDLNTFNNTALSYITSDNYGVGFKDAKTLTIRFSDSASGAYITGKEFRYMIMYCEV